MLAERQGDLVEFLRRGLAARKWGRVKSLRRRGTEATEAETSARQCRATHWIHSAEFQL